MAVESFMGPTLQSHTQALTKTHIEIDTNILTDTHILQIIKSQP